MKLNLSSSSTPITAALFLSLAAVLTNNHINCNGGGMYHTVPQQHQVSMSNIRDVLSSSCQSDYQISVMPSGSLDMPLHTSTAMQYSTTSCITSMPTPIPSIIPCTSSLVSFMTSTMTMGPPECRALPSPAMGSLGGLEFRVFQEGYQRSNQEARNYCMSLARKNVMDNSNNNSSQIIPGYSTATSAPYFPSPSSDASTSDSIILPFGNSTLADVSNADLFKQLSQVIAGPVYINSWQGDNYNGSCIALFPGGAIAVPREGCNGPLGFICQVNTTALSTDNVNAVDLEYSEDNSNYESGY